MAAGSLSNVGEPKFRTPEVVRIGNNPPPTTPPGMFVVPPPPDTTWLDLENREYSEFQISVDANFHITPGHANNGARFRLFIYRSTDAEIAVDINPWLDEVVKIPGTSVSKIYVLNVECYQVSGEEYLRYKVTNLIFDHEERKDKTWSSSKIKETINAVINDEEVSLTGTWSSTKLKQAIDSKQDKIESSLQVDEIVRKSNAEIGGLTFLSKSTHKDWGDREDQWPSFQFISRVFDGYGNVVFESIPLYLNGAGVWEAFKLNATSLTLNNLRVATESFVNAAIQNLSNLMSTDAERIAAINELTQSYNAADDQLQQTLTTALATKAGKAVNEEISGIYNFLNGLLVNGISLNDLFLGKSATAQDADKLDGFHASQFLRSDTNQTINARYSIDRQSGYPSLKGVNDFVLDATTKLYLNHYSGTDIIMAMAGGAVGLGTTSPTAKLDVNGNHLVRQRFFVGSSAFYDQDAIAAIYGSGRNMLTIQCDDNSLDRGIAFRNSGGAYIGAIYARNNTDENNSADIVFANYLGTSTDLSALVDTMILKRDGKVGIGTNSPTEKLHVLGNIKSETNSGIIGLEATGSRNSSRALLIVKTKSDNAAEIDLLHTENDGEYGWVFSQRDSSENSDLVFFSNANGNYTKRVVFQNYTGNVGIGTTNPTEKLEVTGNIVASGTITNGSDRRQKSNIQPLTSRGELNPVTFIKNGKPDLGFIAQEVKELYPELVAGEETEDTFLTLNYSQLTAVLYAELKELRAEVKHLKQLIQNDTNV